eukprot:m.238610 g.238610  ORF g.238610 m.238610 type:complete len:157 (-) comp21883_c0_seq1:338-808(-)
MLRRLALATSSLQPHARVALRGMKGRSGPDVEPNILAPGKAVITHVRKGGFVVDGYVVQGSLAVWNGVFMKWGVSNLAELNEDSLALFPLVNPALEILVIGTGDKLERVPPNIAAFLKSKGIMLEVQNSSRASATYNFLTEEGRCAAAVLLPVSNV